MMKPLNSVSPEQANAQLRLATRKGDVAFAEAAIEAGANVNEIDRNGLTPLHHAASVIKPNVARLLIEHGADVNARDDAGQTPLHWAARFGHCDIAKLLIHQGADLNATDASQETPIHWAVKVGHYDIVDLLNIATKQKQGHADRVTESRKDKGPPQVGG